VIREDKQVNTFRYVIGPEAHRPKRAKPYYRIVVKSVAKFLEIELNSRFLIRFWEISIPCLVLISPY
jgi:hypothetical protein